MTSSRNSAGSQLRDALPILADEAEYDVRLDEPMSKHTTLRLGGPADLWVRPRSVNAVRSLLHEARRQSIPVTSIGGGTNVLVRDRGIRGIVLNLGHLNAIETLEESENHGRYRVQAGTSTGRLLLFAQQRSFGGLEFLAGVPGSVGGGLIMNAGTYLGEFTNVVESVTSFDLSGCVKQRTHAECGFRYRASDLPPDEIVAYCEIHLQLRNSELIEQDVRTLREHRKQREPSGVPNNGSTFKNPAGDFAGRLIESAKLKGVSVGGAQVSPKHANWLVVANRESCTSADMIALIDLVRQRVHEHHGVWLEREVKIIGDLDEHATPSTEHPGDRVSS